MSGIRHAKRSRAASQPQVEEAQRRPSGSQHLRNASPLQQADRAELVMPQVTPLQLRVELHQLLPKTQRLNPG
ncbi:hypothetical protein MHYP_G00088990 [Metynnis hypsauchen]